MFRLSRASFSSVGLDPAGLAIVSNLDLCLNERTAMVIMVSARVSAPCRKHCRSNKPLLPLSQQMHGIVDTVIVHETGSDHASSHLLPRNTPKVGRRGTTLKNGDLSFGPDVNQSFML